MENGKFFKQYFPENSRFSENLKKMFSLRFDKCVHDINVHKIEHFKSNILWKISDFLTIIRKLHIFQLQHKYLGDGLLVIAFTYENLRMMFFTVWQWNTYKNLHDLVFTIFMYNIFFYECVFHNHFMWYNVFNIYKN